jgi:hypothetical protein
MSNLSVSEEKEMLAGIEQVLKSRLVPQLEAIKKQLDDLSASIERQLAILDCAEADREEYRSRRQAA